MAEVVSIIGDGQMGLVMADAVAAAGLSVRLWGRNPERVESLAESRRSPRRLAEFLLPEQVQVTANDAAALRGATMVINAVPTQFIRPTWERLRAHLEPDAPMVSVSKGIENESLLTPTQVMAEVTGDDPANPRRPMGALSGPTIAAELAQHRPATMVAAARDDAVARRIQDVFGVEWLRVYRLDDLAGVELAGALKNVIALAAGMVDGLEAGFNAKSALLSRGLAEIARLGTAMGARVDTFFGVAGVGDLATTCFCPQGRNRTCGERLGRAETLASILESSVSVVEGVATTRSVVQLAKKHGVEMPITAAVHAILFEGMEPKEAIRHLMRREQKAERIG